MPPSDTVNSRTAEETTAESQIAAAEGYGKIINYLVSIAGQGFEIYDKMDKNRQEAKL